MRLIACAALIVGVLLIPISLGFAKLDHDQEASRVERALVAETESHGGALENYFARARSVVLLLANAPAFGNVLAEPGSRGQKIHRQGRSLREVTRQLAYLERLYPGSIGEACFIDARGEEFARVVRGDVARPGDLSTTEQRSPFFAPTFALRAGQTHQTAPYVSPDTNEWVVANATLIPQPDGRKRAILHFEVTIDSFRRALGATRDAELRVVDARSARVVIAGSRSQRVGAPLGVPGDRRFAQLVQRARGVGTGVGEVAGRRVAYRRIRSTEGNANEWMVVASQKAPTAGFIRGMGAVPGVMLGFALVIIVLAGLALRAARRELEAQARTDSLTGLGNRRKLLADLERTVRGATADESHVLALFDLNGFKAYNDLFGHPAGDALLMRLANALSAAVAPFGGLAYRPGGDEFCVIAPGGHREELEQAGCRALSESGEGFSVSTAFGSVVIPQEAADAIQAMRGADDAMYVQKHADSGRATAGRQSSDVLVRALAERHPDLGDHSDGVTDLAADVARRLGIRGEELTQLRHAAALHDVGKVAIPDAIIAKPGPLTEDEWAFMRRHTLIGERIIAGAPALARAAVLVRASHEAWNGSGYPDALRGEAIPLGARIIAVCDSFDAMISARPYSPAMSVEAALAELRRCAGTQFEPAIVAAFEQVMAERSEHRAVRPAA